MAGSLYHAHSFSTDEYIGRDGKTHTELVPVDGDIETMSISSWNALVPVLVNWGAKESDLPVYQDPFDLSTEDIRTKNQKLREVLSTLSHDESQIDYWLNRICEFVRRGESIAFIY